MCNGYGNDNKGKARICTTAKQRQHCGYDSGDKGKTRIHIERTRARPATATNKANARIRMKTTRAMFVTATIARAMPVIA